MSAVSCVIKFLRHSVDENIFKTLSETCGRHNLRSVSNPVPLPDLYFDSFSYPVASILFGDMAIV